MQNVEAPSAEFVRAIAIFISVFARLVVAAALAEEPAPQRPSVLVSTQVAGSKNAQQTLPFCEYLDHRSVHEPALHHTWRFDTDTDESQRKLTSTGWNRWLFMMFLHHFVPGLNVMFSLDLTAFT
jgi:hypothetical protein